MLLPQRKVPRLKGYDYTTPGAYFITICAKNRKCLFGSISPSLVGVDARIDPRADVPVMLTPLGQIVQTHLRAIPGVTAYVVMPNHLHFLLVIPDTGSSGSMHRPLRSPKRFVCLRDVWCGRQDFLFFSAPFTITLCARKTTTGKFMITFSPIQPDGRWTNFT